jgi:hypothetical protein
MLEYLPLDHDGSISFPQPTKMFSVCWKYASVRGANQYQVFGIEGHRNYELPDPVNSYGNAPGLARSSKARPLHKAGQCLKFVGRSLSADLLKPLLSFRLLKKAILNLRGDLSQQRLSALRRFPITLNIRL